ncbi:hypothetical protein PR048_025741 [Dryococelus australis]|uniref:Uncharacterized protein n=1 Tax=Dryococelus australis TaxID=614101 RepID=A0ABQ9GJF8_9NEOP|nr:hypothetical protein PR048_025741 [Dryococelus australis]
MVSGNTETSTTDVAIEENIGSSLQPCFSGGTVCGVTRTNWTMVSGNTETSTTDVAIEENIGSSLQPCFSGGGCTHAQRGEHGAEAILGDVIISRQVGGLDYLLLGAALCTLRQERQSYVQAEWGNYSILKHSEITHLSTSTSAKFPRCEHQAGLTRPGIQPVSPWWEARGSSACCSSNLASHPGRLESIPGVESKPDPRENKTRQALPLGGRFLSGCCRISTFALHCSSSPPAQKTSTLITLESGTDLHTFRRRDESTLCISNCRKIIPVTPFFWSLIHRDTLAVLAGRHVLKEVDEAVICVEGVDDGLRPSTRGSCNNKTLSRSTGKRRECWEGEGEGVSPRKLSHQQQHPAAFPTCEKPVEFGGNRTRSTLMGGKYTKKFPDERRATVATVAERLARSPPTKANRVQSSAGSPDFRKWESCRTMPLVGRFSRGSPVSPTPSFRRRSIFTSITFAGSQDLAVKSHPNLFTSLHSLQIGMKSSSCSALNLGSVTSTLTGDSPGLIWSRLLMLDSNFSRPSTSPGRTITILTSPPCKYTFFCCMYDVHIICNGAAVNERLDCSHPTKANRVKSPTGSLPDARKWVACLTMPLVSGFSRGYSVSPALAFRAASYSPHSHSSALKTSLLSAAEISQLNYNL